MKLVNITDRIVYSSRTGNVNPGRKTSDCYHDLEKAIKAVVDMCGTKFGVILNDNEAKLLNKLIDLDERGSKFDPNTIPAEVRRDPMGLRRVRDQETAAQHAILENNAKANADAAHREAMINGETEEVKDMRSVTPLGVDRSHEKEENGEGQPASGFQAILQENARIAAEAQITPKNALNPVNALAKENGNGEPVAGNGEPSAEADAPQNEAENTEGDAPADEAQDAAPDKKDSKESGGKPAKGKRTNKPRK